MPEDITQEEIDEAAAEAALQSLDILEPLIRRTIKKGLSPNLRQDKLNVDNLVLLTKLRSQQLLAALLSNGLADILAISRASASLASSITPQTNNIEDQTP